MNAPNPEIKKEGLDKNSGCAILPTMRIQTSSIKGWNVASKTRPIKAKPLINLLVDRTVTSKFLVDTLEGKEPLGDGVVICLGEAGDAWQQMPKKLLGKYDVTAIDTDGWMFCTPKPDNSVNCVEVTMDLFVKLFPINANDIINSADHAPLVFQIVGQWGETVGAEKNIQRGTEGDFICQNRTDPTDVWVVRRKLFLNTYIIKS